MGVYSASRLRDYAEANECPLHCSCGDCSQCAASYLTPKEAGEIAGVIDTLRAQLEAAEAELEALKHDVKQYMDSTLAENARAEAAEAECARLREDADRFRFIAAQPTDEWMSVSGDLFRTLAEAVDASMAARTKEQQA